ncbi:hypothetical protein NN561_013316 [Cricetulus griseus]
MVAVQARGRAATDMVGDRNDYGRSGREVQSPAARLRRGDGGGGQPSCRLERGSNQDRGRTAGILAETGQDSRGRCGSLGQDSKGAGGGGDARRLLLKGEQRQPSQARPPPPHPGPQAPAREKPGVSPRPARDRLDRRVSLTAITPPEIPQASGV